MLGQKSHERDGGQQEDRGEPQGRLTHREAAGLAGGVGGGGVGADERHSKHQEQGTIPETPEPAR